MSDLEGYVAALPSAADQVAGATGADDLSLFTNSEFFDFDMVDELRDIKPDVSQLEMQDARLFNYSQPETEYDDLDLSNVTIPFDTQGQYNQAIVSNGMHMSPGSNTSSSRGTTISRGKPDNYAARDAAEEDKRRRNTAASARFRIKKKQREQALEKEARILADRVGGLEEKVRVLSMENRMLRDLVTKK